MRTAEAVYRECDMIVKVKEPIEPEYELVHKGQLLFTYFHFACEKELTDAMLKSGAVCLAYPTRHLSNTTYVMGQSQICHDMSWDSPGRRAKPSLYTQ